MRSRLAQLLTLIAAIALPALGLLPTLAHSERGLPRAALSGSNEDPNGARVIVKYKALGSLMRAQRADANANAARGPQHAATLARRHGLVLTDGRIIEGRTQVVRGDKSLSSAALAARLAADPEVEYAVPDLRRYALAPPNDPLYAASAGISPAAGQWYLRAPDSTLVSAINAEAAWNVTTGAASIVVADVDTGVLFNHPDLANKLYPGYDFISNATTAGDNNGRDSDASDNGDWSTTNQCGNGVAAESSSWHGTQTSGLIGAQSNNGVGMASVGYNVMVLPVRVLGKCGGTDSDIIAGMLWAGGVSSNPVVNPHPAQVINLSLGGSGSCTAAYADVISQLTAKGVVVVVAAGNDEGLAVGVPANCAGVIAVAGVRHTGTKVGFSSIGPEVAIAAPGGNCVNTSGPCLYPILTTRNTGTTTPASGINTYSDSVNYSVGTSFATPMVAGAAALMLSANPALTPAQVKAMLMSSARPFPTTSTDSTVLQCRAPTSTAQDECICTTSTCGAGLLDVAAAVRAAAVNGGPTASVSASASTVLTGASVTFDGSASSAPSGRSIAGYQWAITGGSSVAAFSGSSTAATARIVTSGVGLITVQLTVTDSAGLQASSTATLTVNAPGAPTVSVVASTAVVTAGGSVTFDGSGSAAATGLGIASYQWTIIDGSSLATFTTATNTATVGVATVSTGSGSFTVLLTVTDSVGQQSRGARSVTVTAVTPTASINASAATVTVGAGVTFDGSGSTAAAGRTLRSYQWAITSGSGIAAFNGSTSAATASVSTSATGSFTVQLTVTDSAGVTDVKTATVTVNAVATGGGGTPSGGGGGGAMSGAWVLGLLAAAAALFRSAPSRP